MRSFCRPRSFDCVLSLSTSFGYFEEPGDDRAVLVNAFRSLRPRGAFLIQMTGREKTSRDFGRKDAGGERVQSPDGSVCIVEPRAERTAAGGGAWFEKLRVVLAPDGTRREFSVSHRLYSAGELTHLLRECGFDRVETYGDLAGQPHGPESSELVALAHRP